MLTFLIFFFLSFGFIVALSSFFVKKKIAKSTIKTVFDIAKSKQGQRVIKTVYNHYQEKRFSYEPETKSWPFYKKPLLTPSERVLFHKLKLAFPKLNIFVQVDLGQILEVKKGYDFKAWRNRINRMSLDYVLADQKGNVLCCIELDDASHLRKDRIIADNKKNKALQSAGIPLLRIPVKNSPTPEQLNQQIKALIQSAQV